MGGCEQILHLAFSKCHSKEGQTLHAGTHTHTMYTHTEKDATNLNNLIKTKSCPCEKTLLKELTSTEFTG